MFVLNNIKVIRLTIKKKDHKMKGKANALRK